MKIELLYIDDCPSWQAGLKNMQAALQLESIQADIELVNIHDDAEADHLRFLGSPSFRVDGRELWPEERQGYSVSCRIYVSPEGAKGWPSVEMLRQKLRQGRE